jgi:methionine synthase II (cobalamin-independent)
MPGTDPVEASSVVFDELPDLPYLPELPARGPGADMIGRAAALLTDLPVETTPAGWRLAPRPGRDLRRARDLLARDLDTLEQAADGYQGPLKLQVCGPWTLAAALELPASQDAALVDHGAVADLTASLAEGVRQHLAEVTRRVPGATLLLQLDEPGLPAVLEGSVPTPSGWRRYPAVEAGPAAEGLRTILSATSGFGLVHCCAPSVPFRIIRDSTARGVYFDLSLLRSGDGDPLAEAIEAGTGIFAGAVESVGSQRLRQPGEIAKRIINLWRRLGLPLAGCAQQVVIVPACGLAGASPDEAVAVLAACREAAKILPEMIEEGDW